MSDDTQTFEKTRARLEGILVEVRRKDTSLEQSLELLEEGVRLLNQCNELIDQTAWKPPSAADGEPEGEDGAMGAPVAAVLEADASAHDPEPGQPLDEDAEQGADEPSDPYEAPDDERA